MREQLELRRDGVGRRPGATAPALSPYTVGGWAPPLPVWSERSLAAWFLAAWFLAASFPAASVRPRSAMRSAATAASPVLPGVTVVAVMISESGSTARWPL